MAAIAIHALLGYAVIAGLKVTVAGPPDDATRLILLNLKPPAPKPVPEPPKPRAVAKPGSSALPPKALPLPQAAAPLPALPAPRPLIITPPILTGGSPAGTGTNNSGTGGGGTGEGTGGQGSGQGEGIGDGRGFTSARQIRGRFRNSDFPASAKGAGRLKIGVRYAVGPSGRIDQCEIIEPSGYPEVDAMTCRVITDRYRFKPARDGQGIPVTEVLEEDYSWRLD